MCPDIPAGGAEIFYGVGPPKHGVGVVRAMALEWPVREVGVGPGGGGGISTTLEPRPLTLDRGGGWCLGGVGREWSQGSTGATSSTYPRLPESSPEGGSPLFAEGSEVRVDTPECPRALGVRGVCGTGWWRRRDHHGDSYPERPPPSSNVTTHSQIETGHFHSRERRYTPAVAKTPPTPWAHTAISPGDGVPPRRR